jgi:hypothetical protein
LISQEWTVIPGTIFHGRRTQLQSARELFLVRNLASIHSTPSASRNSKLYDLRHRGAEAFTASDEMEWNRYVQNLHADGHISAEKKTGHVDNRHLMVSI